MPVRLVQMLKLYVPLALIAGLIVALPTLVSESRVGRSLGVVCGVAVIALFAWWVTHRSRRPASLHALGERRSMTVEVGAATSAWAGSDGAAAARMMRRFARLRWLTRLWPVIATAGLVVGGLVGAWIGSFVLTLLFAAFGFLVTSLAPMGFALRAMRQLSSARPPGE